MIRKWTPRDVSIGKSLITIIILHSPSLDTTPVYLDYNATTPLAPEVLVKINEALTTGWANPGSKHKEGKLTGTSATCRLIALLDYLCYKYIHIRESVLYLICPRNRCVSSYRVTDTKRHALPCRFHYQMPLYALNTYLN